MALINCPDCNNDISDKAPACPKCGCPNKQQHWVAGQNQPRATSAPNQNSAATQRPITIQATAKKYKTANALGGFGIFLGFAALFFSPPLGGVVIFAGLCSLTYGTVGAWWHHS